MLEFRKLGKQHQAPKKMGKGNPRRAADSQGRKQSVHIEISRTVAAQKNEINIMPGASEYILKGELKSW